MNIEQEIRDQIERNKELKQEVGHINNHLSILEGFCREDKQKQVDDAYQRGLEDGYGTAKSLVWETSANDYASVGINIYDWKEDESEVLRHYSAQDAVELLRNIRERKDSDRIEVGDEIEAPRGKAVVTAVKDDIVHYFYSGGDFGCVEPYRLTKTGKHYDIASILEAMRE